MSTFLLEFQNETDSSEEKGNFFFSEKKKTVITRIELLFVTKKSFMDIVLVFTTFFSNKKTAKKIIHEICGAASEEMDVEAFHRFFGDENHNSYLKVREFLEFFFFND